MSHGQHSLKGDSIVVVIWNPFTNATGLEITSFAHMTTISNVT